MKTYIALIRKEEGSCYGVDFPDFPGCIAAGNTVEEAQARAVSVLDFHVEGMAEDGDPLPKPTSLDDILKDPDSRDGLVLATQVPLADKKQKKTKVDVTIPGDVLKQVDQYVNKTEGVNRSSFFAGAVLERLQRVAPHKPVKLGKKAHGLAK